MREVLDQSVTVLKGIGPARAKALAAEGITTCKDILLCLPRRYKVRPETGPLSALEEGLAGAAQGQVKKARVFGRGRRRNLRVEIEEDGHGVELVLFGRGYLTGSFKQGRAVAFQGKITRDRGILQCLAPDYHLEGDPGQGFPGLIPVHSLPAGLFPRTFHRMIDHLLMELDGAAPADWREAAGLGDRGFMDLFCALRAAHRPRSLEEAEAARRRLAYEEFFVFQYGLALQRKARQGIPAQGDRARAIPRNTDALYKKCLPFELTGAQARVLEEIREDLASKAPMHRLLQGDVGSGKTVVALYPLLAAASAGGQGAIMAPTEVLAAQHFKTLTGLLDPIGLAPVFLRAGLSSREVKALLNGPEARIFVGTHALIQDRVAFRDLRACVIDEQHKFGVRQRSNLKAKGREPDILVMTAPPIPRSLALTLYGELDVSVLDAMPPGRRPVATRVVPALDDAALTAWLDEELATKGRAFFVCPLVQESEKVDLEAAVVLHRHLERRYAGRCAIGLLHGRMAPEAKERALEAFRTGERTFLVTTVVVEVGVDVPEASTVVILNAWRFGLAQLHQIRGRVGRGSRPSRCYLVGEATTETGRARVGIIEATSDGFQIAEEDLRMRGPGEVLGLRQHGLIAFKAGDFVADVDLMTAARDDARRVTQSGRTLPMEDFLFPVQEQRTPWIG